MVFNPTTDNLEADRIGRDSVPVSRRSVCCGLATVALPFSAGCSSLSNLLDGNPGEVTIFNNTDSTVTATITITNLSEEETILSETTDIDASQAAKFNELFDSATRYRFEVETTAGLSNEYEWDLPSTDHYLYVTIRSDSVEFEEMEP